eukprot:Opistho-2@84455
MTTAISYDCVSTAGMPAIPGSNTTTNTNTSDDGDALTRRCPFGLLYSTNGMRAYCLAQPVTPQALGLEDYCDFTNRGYFGFRWTTTVSPSMTTYDCPLGSTRGVDARGFSYCVWSDLPGASHLRSECGIFGWSHRIQLGTVKSNRTRDNGRRRVQTAVPGRWTVVR